MNNNNIHIRGLRHDEWQNLLKIRLEAITNHPNYFGSTPEKTLKITQSEWHDRINSNHSRIFGLFDDNDLIGITGIVKHNAKPGHAIMIMSYIKPNYRKQGLSELLYQARIDWAKSQDDIHTLEIGHRHGNESSRRANQKAGFTFTHKEEQEWPNGTKDLIFHYKMKL